MEQKYYWIIGIIIVLAIIGMVFISTPFQKDIGEPEPQMALAPYVDVEATVTSLFLDDLHSDCEAPAVCPRDRVTLRIDKINRTGDPSNTINLDVGDETEFSLKYSARPAKLRYDLQPNCPDGWVFEGSGCMQEGCEGPECSVSSPQYDEKPAELEGGYIIYHLPERTDEVTEEILLGLEENSKIKVRIWSVHPFGIGKYELI